MITRNDHPFFQYETYDHAHFEYGDSLDVIECKLANGLMIKLHKRLNGFDPQIDIHARTDKGETYVLIHYEKRITNQIKNLWSHLIECRLTYLDTLTFARRRDYRAMMGEN